MKITTMEIPYRHGASDAEMRAMAVSELNEKVEREGIEVINIETMFSRRWFGLGQRANGLRVWYRTTLYHDPSLHLGRRVLGYFLAYRERAQVTGDRLGVALARQNLAEQMVTLGGMAGTW